MKYWKEHVGLRLGLIFAFFVAGMVLLIVGWKMTGKLAGLGLMIVGLILLLSALMIYLRTVASSALLPDKYRNRYGVRCFTYAGFSFHILSGDSQFVASVCQVGRNAKHNFGRIVNPEHIAFNFGNGGGRFEFS